MRISSRTAFLMIIGGALTWGSSSSANPAAGKLPRPSPKAGANTAQGINPSASAEDRRHCLDDLVTVPTGNGLFSPDGRMYYLLATEKARAATTAKRIAGKAASGKPRYSFLRIDLGKAAAIPSVALSQLSGASLVAYNHPLQGISAVVFRSDAVECQMGEADLVSVSFKRTKDRAVRTEGRYGLVQGDIGLILYDVRQQAIIDMDYVSFQSRVAHDVAKGERPLFFDREANIIVTFKPGERKLTAAKTTGGKSLYEYRLEPGEKILQTRGSFAVVSQGRVGLLSLSELPAASAGKLAQFKIDVPDGRELKDLRLRFHPTRKLLLLDGANAEVRDEWRKVFVIDYAANKVVHQITVPIGQQVQMADISRDGKRSVYEVVDSLSRELRNFVILDHDTGEKRRVKGL